MSLIPWKTKHSEDHEGQLSPWSGFRSEMDRLFDSFFGEAAPTTERPWEAHNVWGPPIDVEETDKEYHVRAEIPGVQAENLDLAIRGNALVISGEKKESQEKQEKGYFYQERRYGSFHREVPLPTAVNEDEVHAEYKDGVLSVTLKKSEEALPKRIKINPS